MNRRDLFKLAVGAAVAKALPPAAPADDVYDWSSCRTDYRDLLVFNVGENDKTLAECIARQPAGQMIWTDVCPYVLRDDRCQLDVEDVLRRRALFMATARELEQRYGLDAGTLTGERAKAGGE